jgi:hypothetical protein
MPIFCIPKNLVQKLRDSALKGEVDIRKLYDMTSQERRDFFTGFTDANLGKLLNTEFEKAMVSKQKRAITDWAQSVFSPKEKTKPAYKSILDKINAMDEDGILSPKTEDAFLEDLVSDKLGVNVSIEEIRIIAEKAKEIQALQEIVGDDLGSPAMEKETLDFLLAKKDMDDYLQSQNPAHALKILTGTIGRGAMLASVKSPILNIGSNIEVGFTEALSRRIAAGTMKGTNNKLAIDYVKMVNRIYQKTGYDLARMTNIKDTGASGERVLGDDMVHSKGEGAVRKVGQVFEDIVFKQLMGAPDVAFASAHFADSLNLNALKYAKGNEKLAGEIMADAMRIEPKTSEGIELRAQAILDAQVATWTNKTWASDLTAGIRKLLNSATGDVRAGDYLLPFIKTPANVIATGMDYAGGGGVKALYKTVNAIRNGEFNTKKYWASITRDLIRSGIGLAGAAIIAANLDDDDFVGAYDPARAQIESLRGSNYNAIRIGNKWISIDWLGPLSVPVTAIMYARKYADTIPEGVFQYTKGVTSNVLRLPGVKDIIDTFDNASYKKNQTFGEMAGEFGGYVAEQAFARLVPSIVSDIAKATDSKERETDSSTAKTLQSKIPGLRQMLPEKKDIFGETVKTEPAWSVILFGSRVKTDKETALIKEISDLSTELDKPITFTNWDKSSSMQLAQFKETKGVEKFEKAKTEYGQKLQDRLEKIIKSPAYQKADPDVQIRLINNADSEVTDAIYKKYGFKYKTVKKDKLPKI